MEGKWNRGEAVVGGAQESDCAAPAARAPTPLAPSSATQEVPTLHTGTITTDCPNEMWGTDGLRIETVEEGWSGCSRRWIISTLAAWESMW